MTLSFFGPDIPEIGDIWSLNERSRIVLSLRLRGLTCAEIGRRFHVGRERIRQIEQQTLESLRRMSVIRNQLEELGKKVSFPKKSNPDLWGDWDQEN